MRFPSWSLQRIWSEQPERRQHPIVLYAESGRNGFQVIACSPCAARCGVTPGTPLAEAKALLEQSGSRFAPAACLLRHDPQADRATLQKLAAWCRQFSPIVGFDDAEQPESLLVDIQGCAHLFHGERVLAEQIVEALDRRGFFVRAGIADTVGAAWALTHYEAVADEDARRTPAALQSCAVHIIEPGQQQEAIRDLPVAALRLDAKVIATLGQLDIRTIGQLLQLPRESLPARFGKELVKRLDQALGNLAEQITPARSAEPVAEAWSLEHPVADSRIIERVLRRLITQLVEQLRFRCEGIQRFCCTLHCVKSDPVEFAVKLIQPSVSVPHLCELAEVQLQRIRLPGAVETVRVRATTTAPLEFSQPALFADDANYEGARELALLIDRLSSRLGAHAVLRPDVVPDDQPEYASRYEPVIAKGGSGKQAAQPSEEAQKSTGGFSTRPLCLRRKPPAVKVMSVVPDGPPYRVHWDNADYRVVRCWGPERIEAGWWRRRHVRRDYYRVEIDTGQQLWLYRDTKENTWRLHGTFE